MLAEIEAAARKHVAALGLDPSDTRGRELYYALIGRYHVDNSRLEDTLGIKSSDSTGKRLKAAVEFSSHAQIPRDIWALKNTAAKELLRVHPPRRLMKFMHYRSVDSMLKRGNISQIFTMLPMVESPRWINAFWKIHSQLNANQFETKKAEVIAIPAGNKESLITKGKALSAVPQLGVIAVWPNPIAIRMGTLGLSAKILQAISDVRVANTFLKLQQFQPNFGNLLVKTWRTGASSATYLDDLAVPWRSLQFHYGNCPASQHPSMLEPHIQAEDLYYQSAVQAVAKLFSAGQWWARSEKLAALYKSGPVSMNLLDVAANYAANKPYRKRKYAVFQAACMDGLMHKYLTHKSIENHLLEQLEKAAIKGHPSELFEVNFSSPSNHKTNIA
jgi:hypothetical protein